MRNRAFRIPKTQKSIKLTNLKSAFDAVTFNEVT